MAGTAVLPNHSITANTTNMFNHFGKTGQFSISQLFFYLERLPARCYINGRARREREGEREREREREREGGGARSAFWNATRPPFLCFNPSGIKMPQIRILSKPLFFPLLISLHFLLFRISLKKTLRNTEWCNRTSCF